VDDQTDETSQDELEPEPVVEVIERVALNDSPEGKAIAAAFVDQFGRFVNESVRPVLRQVADAGGEPQLLMNGLAELMRLTADSIEFPLGHDRPRHPR
jgi:hypothetical protein